MLVTCYALMPFFVDYLPLGAPLSICFNGELFKIIIILIKPGHVSGSMYRT